MSSHPVQGLSRQEAFHRLRSEGPNEVPSALQRSALAMVLELLSEPMVILLVGCGAIYVVLGDLRESLLLLGSILVIIGIEFYQAHKTERALEALRDLSSPRALVIRDGERLRIPGREVVRGDLVVLAEGDRVPADGLVRRCEHLLVDESLLTGESMPVRKQPDLTAQAMHSPGEEGMSSVFSGTLVVSGQGLAEAVATGPRTAMGRIGKSLQAIAPEQTQVQQETARLVRVFAGAGLSLCVLVAVLYGVTRGNWLQGALAGLTLAISMVPEELPVILTVFLALGAWRISRQRVLTRRVPAVETLGATQVLCVDKTGTLTLNRMTVQQLYVPGASWTAPPGEDAVPPDAFRDLITVSVLASRQEPFDPMEQALHRLASRLPLELPSGGWTMTAERPLSQELLAVVQTWRTPDDRYLAAAKGAPEAIAQLCRLQGAQADELSAATRAMALEGLRVLGVARAHPADGRLSESPQALAFEWLGLVALADPVRPSVPAAIQECREAGIRVVMITGDYPVTAQQIARQIGLEPSDGIITGKELERLDDSTLRRRIQGINVFARIVPEQKLRLVSALKAGGAIVAMTGDGVNDAPALKSAHIGIAMGARGTDVAREASSLVLLDDDFSSIVHAVRIGRRIFDNLRKAAAYIFAIHVAIAGVSLIPVVFRLPLVLLPMHIVFLELIIDPACSIAFEAEPEEADVMRRPPRSRDEPVFTRQAFALGLLQGAGILLLVLGVFALTLWQGKSEPEVRAMTFTSLIIGNLALILTNRSWTRTILQTVRTPNTALWWIFGGALLVLALVLYAPPLREVFHVAVLHPDDLLLCTAIGGVGVAWFELLKHLSARWRVPPSA